jgi:MFS family permease
MGRLDRRETAGKPGFFSSLVYPDYRRLWTATACAQSAGWALIVLRGALVFQITESAVWVGYVTMAALLPGLVVTPLSGLVADRFDRRRVLALTYVFNTAHNVLLGFLAIGGIITAQQILWLAMLNGSIRAIELPTNQALLPNLVPRERLLNAVALSQLMQQGSRMIGPLLILPIITFVDPEPAFFMCVGLYALGWIQVLRIKTVSRGVIESGRSVAFNVVAGIRYIYTHPILLSLMALTVAHCALTMAFESVFPFFSRAQLGMETEKDLFEGPTYLMIGVGAGSILGNLALARVEGQVLRGQLFFGLGLLSGLTPIALGFTSTIPQAVIAAGAMGATTAAFMTLSHGMVQAIAPDGVRGRVMSANTWHVQGAMGGFNYVNAMLMELPWFTAPILLTSTGLAFVAIMIASLLAFHLRAIYSRGIPAEYVPAVAH